MSMSDPIADMLTRIRNAQAVKRVDVLMPASKQKRAIAEVLEREGYIQSLEILDAEVGQTLRIVLKYYLGAGVIESIRKVSCPGLRVFRGKSDIPKVMGGLGIAIISTSKGVMSDRQARAQGHGGEVLCYVT